MKRSTLLFCLLALLACPAAVSHADPAETSGEHASTHQDCWRFLGLWLCPPGVDPPSPRPPLRCADCELRTSTYSSTLKAARVHVPLDLLLQVDALFLSTDEDTRIQLWPLEYFTGGPVFFDTLEDQIFLLYPSALRGRHLAELTLEAERDGALGEVLDVQRKDFNLVSPMPGSTTCTSCLVTHPGNGMRIRIPRSVLRASRSLRVRHRVRAAGESTASAEEDVPVWPPTASRGWLSVSDAVGDDGEHLLEILLDDASDADELVMEDVFGNDRMLVP